ncbi:FAD-dependent oxidoreductase [Cocleimonas flava]|uniref:Glycine/D-amino acid oxidase-like deaminating enzyme n=1 Tax=Cocleimonas flava TaxID=634765 RepID=A0A4R1F8P7_9GAMM|nr:MULTISPECIES: FAD-dependent oxidoreductase [Cocleimonas]MEB8431463.1 FAD-dependent oxidoreductase [Cocleimonas sp. KMM 6892]MEC4713765.1 FAD-dependent oxidoreductase [Cocleimonas sp. KMM 6895]MEC4743096.1 FAD-dependent oxidoreductase [Cocleimonas sp. KMM 6896]TCJ89142.1 glycine/D-amino acid oxidase-like deaminating enzyme [Cocleimonas flava]
MLKFKDADQSLWQHTAVKLTRPEPLKGAVKADVTIVGAGFTGLRTALELAQKGVNVIVLDMHEPGWGASGRSGGQVNPLAHAQPSEIIEQLGDVFGNRVLNNYIHSADEVFDLIDKHDLKCDSVRKGWLRAAHSRSSIPELEKMAKNWSDMGLDIDSVEGEQLNQLSGSTAYSYATRVESGGSIHPLSYTRELARVAMEHGAQIYSDSKVSKVERKGDKWQLTTDTATIDSEWVVFCTNGYTDDTLKGLKQTIIPLISVQAATRELTDEEYAQVLPEGHTIADTRRVIYYGRKDNRNRILLGSLGSSELCVGTDRDRIHNAFKTVFPQFKPEDIEFYWGGRIAHTKDLLPHLHEPAPGILAGLGCNGRGVAMGTVIGRILSERVLGKEQQDLAMPTTPYKSFAFHRFHEVGVSVTTKYFEMRDALEVKFS